LYIPEADFEYLIRTLSEARSRATELAVSVGSRLGAEHQLTQLANTAASNIEITLREVRNAASDDKTDKQDSALGIWELHGAMQPETPAPAPSPAPAPEVTASSAPSGLDSEHWLHAFVDELLAQARASGGITFESAERLLQLRKDEFLRDFLTARRMYRTYPRLFPEIADEARQAFTP
jgi:hypothetical protein